MALSSIASAKSFFSLVFSCSNGFSRLAPEPSRARTSPSLVEGRTADPVLAADVSRCSPCLLLSQNADDLFFGEPALLHRPYPNPGYGLYPFLEGIPGLRSGELVDSQHAVFSGPFPPSMDCPGRRPRNHPRWLRSATSLQSICHIGRAGLLVEPLCGVWLEPRVVLTTAGASLYGSSWCGGINARRFCCRIFDTGQRLKAAPRRSSTYSRRCVRET